MDSQLLDTNLIIDDQSININLTSRTSTSTFDTNNAPDRSAMPCTHDPTDRLQRSFSIIPHSQP